jgi:hypothetical protein
MLTASITAFSTAMVLTYTTIAPPGGVDTYAYMSSFASPALTWGNTKQG